MEEKPDLELKGLNGFIGTQNYYQYMGVLFTDGIRYIMENGYSWFVTDAIAVIVAHQKIRRHLQKDDFLTIKLKLGETVENSKIGLKTAQMIITDGNDNILYTQNYEWTDAKKELKLFYTGNTLMLASEW
jgi:hypothetical protein